MKTMNYLFTAAFVILLTACSNESQNVELDLQSTKAKGKEIQEGPVYLELDLHQWALEFRIHELRLELVRIEEEIESSEGFVSEELQGRMERVQRMIDEGRFEHERLSEVISEYRRGPRGPGRSGNPCGEEGNERCDLDLENATIYVYGIEDLDVKLTGNGETCGELVDMVEAPEYEEMWKLVLEREEGCADEITFKGVDADGQEFSYSLPITN